VVLWAALGTSPLAPATRTALESADSVTISAVSAWEIALKQNLGKLRLQVSDVLGELEGSGYALIPVTPRHAWHGGSLPLHHRDPFDRLLVAQAQLDGYTIVTRDPAIARYQVAVMPA
jgi:PIN domain nuclease of toxin-antitoxin system